MSSHLGNFIGQISGEDVGNQQYPKLQNFKNDSLQQYAETPDLVWGETKSVPCITLQKHAGGYTAGNVV